MVSTIGLWPSTGSNTRSLPNSARTNRLDQIYPIIVRPFCLHKLKRQPELIRVIDREAVGDAIRLSSDPVSISLISGVSG
jgi:hypothetical protein